LLAFGDYMESETTMQKEQLRHKILSEIECHIANNLNIRELKDLADYLDIELEALK